MLGNGHQSIIFNCNNASYYDDDNSIVHFSGHSINDNILRIKNYARYKQLYPDYKITNSFKCTPGKDITNEKDGSWYSLHNEYATIDRQKPWESLTTVLMVYSTQAMKDYLQSKGVSDNVFVDVYLKILRHPLYTRRSKNRPVKNVLLSEIACEHYNNDSYQNDNRKRKEIYQKLMQPSSLDHDKTKYNIEIENDPRIKLEMFGLCFLYVLFNCTKPVFLDLKKTDSGRFSLVPSGPFDYAQGTAAYADSKSFMRDKMGYKCDPHANMWQDKNDNLIAFSVTDTTYHPISMELIGLWESKGICNEAMQLFHHPAYIAWSSRQNYKQICNHGLKVYKEILRQSADHVNNQLGTDNIITDRTDSIRSRKLKDKNFSFE